jgi:nucleoside 2-deoxyribosyltransferase
MFVGDSIAYGTTMVDQDAIFVEVLHRELPAILHCRVEVLNASASAWAIDNELAYIESRGIFQSDRVILVLNDGDLDQRVSTVNDVGSALYFEKPACAFCELVHHYASRARADKGSVVESDAGQREKNLKSLTVFRDYVYAHNSGMILLFVQFESHPDRVGELGQAERSSRNRRHSASRSTIGQRSIRRRGDAPERQGKPGRSQVIRAVAGKSRPPSN